MKSPLLLPPVSPLTGRKATPISFIHALLAAYRRYHADPAYALSLAQITPAMLVDPTTLVTAAQMETMSAVAMQELDDEALGWFSRRLPWGSYGLLCRASLTAPHLGLAIERWCRHHRLLTDDLVLVLSRGALGATVGLHVNRAIGEAEELCLVTIMRYLLGFASWLTDSRLALTGVRFPFEPPPHRPIYDLMFAAPVEFASANPGFDLDANDLNLPVRRDETALQTMLKRALSLTVLPYRKDRLVVERVRRYLSEHVAQTVTATTVAEALYLSVRSLQRHLQQEGASLQALKNQVRCDKASRLLLDSRRSLGQIAMAVGFDNDKSFSRAFKQWSGFAPDEFRRRR